MATTAFAGSVIDTDSDLVPDGFDDCSAVANGPANGSNQVDTDQDCFGNACDIDGNNDCATTTLDFPIYLASFTSSTPDLIWDTNGDGAVTTLDCTLFLSDFVSLKPPGLSGLSCAVCPITGTPCLP